MAQRSEAKTHTRKRHDRDYEYMVRDMAPGTVARAALEIWGQRRKARSQPAPSNVAWLLVVANHCEPTTSRRPVCDQRDGQVGPIGEFPGKLPVVSLTGLQRGHRARPVARQLPGVWAMPTNREIASDQILSTFRSLTIDLAAREMAEAGSGLISPDCASTWFACLDKGP